MTNNINNNNNYNSITVQQEITTKTQQEKSTKIPKKELQNRVNNLYEKIIIFLETSLNPSLKEENSKIFLIPNKNLNLSFILKHLKFNKNEYDGYALKYEVLDEELKLLQKVWNILLEIKSNTFLEKLKEYETNPNSSKEDDEFIRIKELHKELKNLFTFYEKNINYKAKEINIENEKDKENKNFNNFNATKSIYNKLSEADSYFNIFKEGLFDAVQYRITRDSWSKDAIIKKGIKSKKNEGDYNKEVTIYGSHKIKKKDRILMTFLDLYNVLKTKRDVFRKLLDNVKDLNYLEKIIEKEKETLKFLFSYLENLVRKLNINNCVGGLNPNEEEFELNYEFSPYFPYDSKSEDCFSVTFKYIVCDVIENFYEVEIENMENIIGKKIEKLDEVEYVRDEKEEEKLIKTFENLYKENNAYYEFIFHSVFDAITTKLLNSYIFARSSSSNIGCKYKMQKFYNLQNLCRIFFETSKDFIKKLVRFYHAKYYESIIYCLKNEKAMLHKIYDFIMSYVPNLKDKEKFIKADFKKFSDKEKEEIKNSFKKVFLDEIEKVKDPVVVRDDLDYLDYLDEEKYPAIYEKIHENDNSSIDFEKYTMDENHINNSIRDINFNSIFNKIESVVDKYGNLKQNKMKNNETVKDDSFLGELFELLNEIIKFYFNEKNGKFYFYETFNRLSNHF